MFEEPSRILADSIELNTRAASAFSPHSAGSKKRLDSMSSSERSVLAIVNWIDVFGPKWSTKRQSSRNISDWDSTRAVW